MKYYTERRDNMTLTAAAQWLNTAFAGYDKAILKIMHSLAGALGPVLTPLMKLITFLGEKGLLLLLLSLVLMCFARTRRIGVCVFGAVCCGALITNFILKDWIARPRPFETVDLYCQWWQAVGSPAEDGYSFPSGHVTAAAAGMTALCLMRGRKLVVPSVIVVLLMAISRNYLMAHYPSDVLFAAIIGVASAFIAYYITRLIFRLLEDHEDAGICAFVLNFDLPVRLPGAYKGRHEKSSNSQKITENCFCSSPFFTFRGHYITPVASLLLAIAALSLRAG